MGLRAALLAALLAAPGRAATCLEAAALQPRTAFDVVVATYPTVVERRLDIQEINLRRPGPLPPKALAHGLSVADYRFRCSTKSETACWEPGDKEAWAWIGTVSVDLTPEAVRIYIPREYPPDGCESKELLRHEAEHERLYRRGIQKAAEAMRLALAQAHLPGPSTPISAATPEEAYARLKLLVDKVVRPIYDDFLKAIAREQEALDSPETYRRLGESCSGWRPT